MQITPINQNNKNQSFGMKFKLSKETVKSIEKSTGLTYKEMTELPLDKCENLMKERGRLKEPNKLWTWLQDKYKNFGERTGLLKKEYKFYTDID